MDNSEGYIFLLYSQTRKAAMDKKRLTTLTQRANSGMSTLCRELTSQGMSYHALAEMYQSQMAIVGLMAEEVHALRKEIEGLKRVQRKRDA